MEKNADRSVDVHEQGFPEGNLTLIQKRRINMATDKVALTASMRSNLLSLKNTQKMFDKTQDRLSTGYKVNSAMDNPSSYFTAQSLNSRADDLSSLLDSIGQAISTLKTADEGITSLQDFVEQAKSIANSARDTANVSASTKSTIKFDKDALKSQKVVGEAIPNAKAGDTMVIRYGDSTKITGTTNVQEDTLLSGIELDKLADGDASIKVNGKEYKIVTDGATENKMVTGSYAKDSIFKVTEAANDGTKTTYKAVDADGNEITWEKTEAAASIAVDEFAKAGAAFDRTVTEDGKTTMTMPEFTKDATATAATATMADAATIYVKSTADLEEFAKVLETMIGSDKFSASIVDGNMVFATKDTTSIEITGKFKDAFGMDEGAAIKVEADDTAESLRQKIDKLEGIAAEFDNDGRLVIKSEQGDDMVISGALAEKLGVNGAVTNGNNERATYASQFNKVLIQINELVQDTSYKGINLLKGDDLTVVFNESRTSNLELKGVTFDAQGLGFTDAINEWKDTDSIDTALDQINKATSLLRAQASEFGQNLSTVQIRQDFTENMINNLQTGADKLTLADMNEESANLLALQTRQQLATNSLSMANQAAQSVLSLF